MVEKDEMIGDVPVSRMIKTVEWSNSGCSGNKRSNLSELKFDVKFCDTKVENFQATFLILLAECWSRGY